MEVVGKITKRPFPHRKIVAIQLKMFETGNNFLWGKGPLVFWNKGFIELVSKETERSVYP